ncbi:MAG: RNA-binding protein hfq [Coleofasciculus sp. B1-GNL1-01]|uniref:Hfq-related RNA-binding protein n=1 Tax=Coleofasciculus sp. B1-GNL1-01 TaxID=3068484 RepID=UPI0032F8EB14
MSELSTNLPSVRQLQGLIREAQEVEVKLMTNEIFTGRVRWQDTSCLCILDEQEQPIIIWHHAIAYIKPKGGGGMNRSLQVRQESAVANSETAESYETVESSETEESADNPFEFA